MLIFIVATLNALLLALILKNRNETGLGFDAIPKLILKYFPEGFTGRSIVIRTYSERLHGDRFHSDQVLRQRLITARWYSLLWVLFTVAVVSSAAIHAASGHLPMVIARPGHGAGNDILKAEVQIKDSEQEVKKDVELIIREKQLTVKEESELLRAYAKLLPKLILGLNADLDHVTRQLQLPEIDPETGIGIRWSSSDSAVLDEDGHVNPFKIKESKKIVLTATLDHGETTLKKEIAVYVRQSMNEEYRRMLMYRKIDKIVDSIGDGKGSGPVILPQRDEDGLIVEWAKSRDVSSNRLLLVFMAACMAVFLTKYSSLSKEYRQRRTSMEHDFPDFIERFILLLNAGLVVTAAFSKTVKDHDRYNSGDRKPLYEELRAIDSKVNGSNSSLVLELRKFAERSGVREIMSFSAIVSDNIGKGSRLADKLEAEGNLMWNTQKKRAEELGRLADTKMTAPLAMLLIVLLLITVAPAMLDM